VRDTEDVEHLDGHPLVAGRAEVKAVVPRITKSTGWAVLNGDDPRVIAGQGTVGREIAEDIAALGATPDIVLAPVSGGGLIAGVATAVKARFPQAQLMSAEPEGFDDHARSLRSGKREPHRAEGRTNDYADGKIDDIATQCEFFEFFKHEPLALVIGDSRLVGPAQLIRPA